MMFEIKMSKYTFLFLERRPSQSESSQMLLPGGECEGRRVDSGRGGVLQEEAPAAERGQQVSHDTYHLSSYSTS